MKLDIAGRPSIYGEFSKLPFAYRLALAPSRGVGSIAGVFRLAAAKLAGEKRYHPPASAPWIVGSTIPLTGALIAQMTGYAAMAAHALKLVGLMALIAAYPATALIGLSVLLDIFTGFKAMKVGFHEVAGYEESQKIIADNWRNEVNASQAGFRDRSRASRVQRHKNHL